jgi:hypothetical protein
LCDGVGLLLGLAVGADVCINGVRLCLADAHTLPVEPVLAPITPNVEPARPALALLHGHYHHHHLALELSLSDLQIS